MFLHVADEWGAANDERALLSLLALRTLGGTKPRSQ